MEHKLTYQSRNHYDPYQWRILRGSRILAKLPGDGYTIAQSKANAERICLTDNCHDQLVKACEIAVLAMTHEPINPNDIKFIQAAIASALGTNW